MLTLPSSITILPVSNFILSFPYSASLLFRPLVVVVVVNGRAHTPSERIELRGDQCSSEQ